jgi:cell division protein FtsB
LKETIMALKPSGVDQTLAIVKDADKFKARIAELAKAEASADKAMAASKAMNTKLFAEMDQMTKDAEAKAKMAQDRAKAADKAANVAMQPVIEAQAQADRLNSTLAGREERLKRDIAAHGVDVEVLKDREVAFAEKVKNFQNAVKAACNGI